MSRRPPAAPRRDDPRVKRQPLPGVLGVVERAAGYPAAERFALIFGGSEIYIPRDPKPDHPLSLAMGYKVARLIGRVLGPDELGSAAGTAIPLGETELKWNIVRRLRLAGLSRNEIVRRLRDDYRFPITAARVGELARGLPAPPRRKAAPAPVAPAPDSAPDHPDYPADPGALGPLFRAAYPALGPTKSEADAPDAPDAAAE